MKWIKTSEQFPPVDQRTGESEYVFVYPGCRCLPQVAKYSNGDWSKKGWHPASDLGKVIPLYKGKVKEQRPYFTYWAEIELPKED